MRTLDDKSQCIYKACCYHATTTLGVVTGTVSIEPFLGRARHMEVHILADGQAHVVHLFERGCSVVKAAPVVHLAEEVRQGSSR